MILFIIKFLKVICEKMYLEYGYFVGSLTVNLDLNEFGDSIFVKNHEFLVYNQDRSCFYLSEIK